MSSDTAIAVNAIATSVYGLATFGLVIQILLDRRQRGKHFREDADNRKLNELRSAFYDAWGYWEGFMRARSEDRDAAQAGRMYEALIRFECQLRLNNYKSQANDLGLVVRTNIHGVNVPLADGGVALGLLPTEYRQFAAQGLPAEKAGR